MNLGAKTVAEVSLKISDIQVESYEPIVADDIRKSEILKEVQHAVDDRIRIIQQHSNTHQLEYLISR